MNLCTVFALWLCVSHFLFSQTDYLIRRLWLLDERQCDLGLKENDQHGKRNRAAAIAMEAIVEKFTPPWVLEQLQILRARLTVWIQTRAREVCSNAARAWDIERRTVSE